MRCAILTGPSNTTCADRGRSGEISKLAPTVSDEKVHFKKSRKQRLSPPLQLLSSNSVAISPRLVSKWVSYFCYNWQAASKSVPGKRGASTMWATLFTIVLVLAAALNLLAIATEYISPES